MKQRFVKARTREQAKGLRPEDSVFLKVPGGYLCFKDMDDYREAEMKIMEDFMRNKIKRGIKK